MSARRQKRDLATRTKRTAKAKQVRLAEEKKRAALAAGLTKSRADVALVMVRGDEQLVVGVRRGLLGHPTSPILRIDAEDLVGAVEDIKELGGICTKLGVMCLAQLLGYNLALGPEGLAKAACTWLGVDLEALKKEAADEDERQMAIARQIMTERHEALAQMHDQPVETT